MDQLLILRVCLLLQGDPFLWDYFIMTSCCRELNVMYFSTGKNPIILHEGDVINTTFFVTAENCFWVFSTFFFQIGAQSYRDSLGHVRRCRYLFDYGNCSTHVHTWEFICWPRRKHAHAQMCQNSPQTYVPMCVCVPQCVRPQYMTESQLLCP